MIRETEGKTKVWIPKTQIENNNLSEWISSQKRDEIENYLLTKRYRYAQVIRLDTFYSDASGKIVKVKATKKEAKYKREREAKRTAALNKAKQERVTLIAQAKANGYNAHERMTTATLTQMARGTYKSKAEKKRQRAEELAKLRSARSKMVKIINNEITK